MEGTAYLYKIGINNDFSKNAHPPKKIAVIGGGISGLGAAYVLSNTYQVTLFEAENRLGVTLARFSQERMVTKQLIQALLFLITQITQNFHNYFRN